MNKKEKIIFENKILLLLKESLHKKVNYLKKKTSGNLNNLGNQCKEFRNLTTFRKLYQCINREL